MGANVFELSLRSRQVGRSSVAVRSRADLHGFSCFSLLTILADLAFHAISYGVLLGILVWDD